MPAPADEELNDNVDLDTGADAIRQFSSGMELGLYDAGRIMRSRYTRLIGVLGQADAGKTCLLLSLYFQLTDRRLFPRYRFAASETLLGFEQRARHLRDWSQGGIPEQIVDHTVLGHSRSPAFLHLAFNDDQGARHDLLLPDLPGEWTTSLLSDASKADRFTFLSRSDAVLIALEAPTFANPRTVNNALTDAKHLLARLHDQICLPTNVPLILAVTKCDQTSGEVPSTFDSVRHAAYEYGYSATTIPLAAFPSQESETPAGFGLDMLLERVTAPPLISKSYLATISDGAARSYLKAGGHR
jgi:hypothetical protein